MDAPPDEPNPAVDTDAGTQRGGPGAALASHPWWTAVAVLCVVAVILVTVADLSALSVIGALLAGLVIVRVGWFFLQQFATPPPPPPDPGTLRKVRLTYRCEVCGAEVRMTSAASEDPEPPRHCMEDMELIATAEDAL